MSAALPLSEVFLSHKRTPGPVGPSAELEQLLRSLLLAGQAAWPRVALDPDLFVRHLAERLPEGGVPSAGLARLQCTDLYLACACQAQLPAALGAFDDAILAQVPAFLARIDRSPDFADEIRQRLRQKLFVPGRSGPAKIADYAGTGPLPAWVRIVAVREAQSRKRRRGEQLHEDIDDLVPPATPPQEDPVRDFLRARYQGAFREAMTEAFSRLPRQQRGVLRLHFAARLTGDQIAATLQISRATVVRWLTAARKAMSEDVRRLLGERLLVPSAELESFIDLVRSRLDTSISDLLKDSQPAPGPSRTPCRTEGALERFVLGGLSAEEAEEVLAHLDECPPCQALLSEVLLRRPAKAGTS